MNNQKRHQSTEDVQSPFKVHRSATLPVNDIRYITYSNTARQAMDTSPSDYRFEQNEQNGEGHELDSTFGSLNNTAKNTSQTPSASTLGCSNSIPAHNT